MLPGFGQGYEDTNEEVALPVCQPDADPVDCPEPNDMIVQHLSALANKHIVLASASPRRKELLSLLGLRFEVVPSSFEENLPKHHFPTAALYVTETAVQKARDVARATSRDAKLPDLIISADTVVEYDGNILEKPADAADALRMLTSLSGQQHYVHTGVCLILPPPSGLTGRQEPPLERSFVETTRVDFDELTPAMVQAYVDTGEPFGKAGAYGIQGAAGSFVKGIQGDYFNVVGFPMHAFAKQVNRLIEDRWLPLE